METVVERLAEKIDTLDDARRGWHVPESHAGQLRAETYSPSRHDRGSRTVRSISALSKDILLNVRASDLVLITSILTIV